MWIKTNNSVIVNTDNIDSISISSDFNIMFWSMDAKTIHHIGDKTKANKYIDDLFNELENESKSVSNGLRQIDMSLTEIINK